jgi:hypothetical protein
MRRKPKVACLLLLLFACGCHVGGFGWSSLLIEPQDLPRDVTESVSRHWPGARIQAAERIYASDSWGDYELTLEMPEGTAKSVILSKTGVIE